MLLALAACSENLFGSPGNSNCGKDIKCLRLDAENAFRNGEYANAYNIYSKIVNIDSTASAGYFGMAKAGLWMKGINPFSVFAQVKTGTEEIAFMNDFPSDQNKFYQGMRFIAPALHELEHRDSITAHYDYHKRSLSGWDTIFVRTMDSVSWVRAVDTNGFVIANINIIDNEDGKDKTYEIPLFEKLRKFRDKYCNDGKNCSGVPLSDREYSYNTYSIGLLITTVSETILKSLDTNKDGCIAKRCPKDEDNCRKYNPGELESLQKWINWGCDKQSSYSYDLSLNLTVNENGEFEVDINQLLEDMQLEEFYEKQRNDPKAELPIDIQDFNDKMDEFNESIYDLISVMGGFKDKGSGENIPFGLESEMGGYKDYSKFYKVGTHIDEDGDGCIGEDIMDGQDNDGDGLVNGNARLAYIDDPNHQYYADDGLMGYHGMTGNRDDDKPIRINTKDPAFASKCIISNNPEGTNCAALNPDEDGYVTVIKFTQRAGYWTSNNRDDKLMVAQDTACPPKISLEQRKLLIGGCWPNYNEDKFVKYWLKRELARDEDREKRVHSTCKSCTGTGCLRR
jgi:hypothetical protein